jgi:hypothetical protein
MTVSRPGDRPRRDHERPEVSDRSLRMENAASPVERVRAPTATRTRAPMDA